MTGTASVDAELRQLSETTVLAHFEAENKHDVAATLATFKSGSARTELPGEVADGPNAVAAAYRELFTAFPDMRFIDIKPESLCHHGNRGDFGISRAGYSPGTVSRPGPDWPLGRSAGGSDLRVRRPRSRL
ncbi:nuclear transport factor 2 family protein [Mycobacterium szulgai]|uniref:nuclear transport factor 2 family protein n=1 Tax=Mycobacterium szulgai TaxID=1787 RepID=UPI00111C7804|nr:nuclear transport factor 2 family protein [Mycobacterium szulgai]MCV7075080.1 nuclear transport factor 2 family protein [Mycobacterium szulgai]